MKVNEFFKNGKGIFKDIFKVSFPDEYQIIFGVIEPSMLDNLVILKYGQKELITAISDDTYLDTCKAIISLNITNWVRYAKDMQLEYDVLKPVKQTVTKTENVSQEKTNNQTETDADISFGDVDFSDSDKQTTDNTENVTQERTTTETLSGYSVNASITDEIKKDIELSFNNWKENIIFALLKEITISIYV